MSKCPAPNCSPNPLPKPVTTALNLIKEQTKNYKEFIGITRYKGIGANNREKFRLSFNQTSLKLAMNYFLDNSYLSLSFMCFLQFFGIPMESDLVPLMAKLSLLYYEKEGLLQTKYVT